MWHIMLLYLSSGTNRIIITVAKTIPPLLQSHFKSTIEIQLIVEI